MDSNMNEKPLFRGISPGDFTSLVTSYKKKFGKTIPELCERLAQSIPKEFPVVNPKDDVSLLCDLMTACLPQYRLAFSNNTSLPENTLWVKHVSLPSKRLQEAFAFQVLPLYTKLNGYKAFQKEVNKCFPTPNISIFCVNSADLPANGAYQTTTFIETQELTHFLMNENSMDMLKLMYVPTFFRSGVTHCLPYLLHFREWQRSLDPYERSHVLVFSSSVLFSIGLRTCNDVDIFVNDEPKLPKAFQKSMDILKKSADIVREQAGKEIFDISMRGLGEWTATGQKAHWDEWFLKDWPALVGASSMNDVVYDPKYHMYFLGMKLTSLEMDIQRRAQRQRPAGYANLIALHTLAKVPIDFPHVPTEYYKSIGVKDTIDTPKKLERFYRTIQHYLRQRYHRNYSLEEIKFYVKPQKIV